jgi:hypothetical protein
VAILKAIHAQEDRPMARQKAEQWVTKLRERKQVDARRAATEDVGQLSG